MQPTKCTISVSCLLDNAPENTIVGFSASHQGRRQEFFQGMAPKPFFKFRGAQPRFLVASMVKMKEFRNQGGAWPPCLCLPTPMLPTDVFGNFW